MTSDIHYLLALKTANGKKPNKRKDDDKDGDDDNDDDGDQKEFKDQIPLELLGVSLQEEHISRTETELLKLQSKPSDCVDEGN